MVSSFFYCESKDGAYMPRHVGIRVGVPVPTKAFAVNRLCGSGFQSVVTGSQVEQSIT